MKTRRTPAFVNTSGRRQNLMIGALVCAVAFATTIAKADDQLPSWNDGPAKQAIVAFVEKVTKEGSPDFVPPNECIITFGNDGTFASWREHRANDVEANIGLKSH